MATLRIKIYPIRKSSWHIWIKDGRVPITLFFADSGTAVPFAGMSNLTYLAVVAAPRDKPLVWLHGEIKTPPFSADARIEAGCLLRKLQRGDRLSMPHARPMPEIGRSCYELRIVDGERTWRIIHRIDPDAIVIAEVFSKKTRKTPLNLIRFHHNKGAVHLRSHSLFAAFFPAAVHWTRRGTLPSL